MWWIIKHTKHDEESENNTYESLIFTGQVHIINKSNIILVFNLAHYLIYEIEVVAEKS